MSYQLEAPQSTELFTSPLVQRAEQQLSTLPLRAVKEAGIWRERESYFLNISYPSMQAMDRVEAEAIYPENGKSEGKSVGLYVHIPYCTAECYYCHYYKLFRRPSDEVDTYLEFLDTELSLHEDNMGSIEAKSVYIGGGTPSYMTPAQIDRLFTTIKRHVSITDEAEVSFEFHPESADDEKLSVLFDYGVNRINIGVESFDDDLLLAENRRHSAAQAVEVFEQVRQAGFHNVNLDLIYGLKGQTIPVWQSSLDTIAELAPASATMYYLRLKRGTPEFNLFKKYPEKFPSERELLLMHAMSFERMEGELGYTQDPVDWFIQDKSLFHRYQDHNWRRSDETELLGIGASAYSYVNGWQYYNINDTDRYQAAISDGKLPVWKGERLQGDERMRRTVMLGMKMGMDRSSFQQTYGIDALDAFPQTWEKLHELGLIDIHPNIIDLSYTGKLLADEVGQQFYSDSMKRRMSAINPQLVSTTWPQFNP